MGRESFKALIIILALSCLSACKKDKPYPVINTAPGATGNVYIVCEGSYGSGNAALYAYQPTKDSVYGDLYKSANGQPLGDVFQSMQHIGDKLFLCVNNSNKVVVLNANNWTQSATLNIPQPRYILPVSPTKAYVSTLYSSTVYVIDPQAMQITGTITMPGNSQEGMCVYNTNAFMCSWDTSGNKIFEVDATTDNVSHSITVAGYAPQEVVLDKEQMLWVLAGDVPEGRNATLTRIDPSTGSILAAYYFPASADPLKPVFNNTKDSLYFIEANYNGGNDNNGIYRMNIHDAVLPSVPFIQAKAFQYFWALGIDPVSGYVYVGDPKGFIEKGSVSIYKADGTQTTTFNVGIGPGHFYFDK